MKKNVLRMALMSLALTVATGGHAQIDLDDLAGKVLGGVSSSASSQTSGQTENGGLMQTLTSVFSKDKQASANNIVGTWSYSEPAILLTSSNILSNAAYKIAANKAESKLQQYLSQYGFAPGSFTMTFNEDGTCVETLKGKSMKGKWQVKDSKLLLTIGGVKTLSITTQIDGNEMMLTVDATKLLNMFKFSLQSKIFLEQKKRFHLLEGGFGILALPRLERAYPKLALGARQKPFADLPER